MDQFHIANSPPFLSACKLHFGTSLLALFASIEMLDKKENRFLKKNVASHSAWGPILLEMEVLPSQVMASVKQGAINTAPTGGACWFEAGSLDLCGTSILANFIIGAVWRVREKGQVTVAQGLLPSVSGEQQNKCNS